LLAFLEAIRLCRDATPVMRDLRGSEQLARHNPGPGIMTSLMTEGRVKALGVPEALKGRHWYVVGSPAIEGAVAAVADGGAGRREELPSSHAIGLGGATEETHLMLVRPSGGEVSVEPR
jgi:hypothetical protein